MLGFYFEFGIAEHCMLGGFGEVVRIARKIRHFVFKLYIYIIPVFETLKKSYFSHLFQKKKERLKNYFS